MRRTINCDINAEALARKTLQGALPRRRPYGAYPGLVPFGEAYPDKLIDPSDYKEVIARCHREQIFPMYHQRNTWGAVGFRWYQNGLPYCWAWSATAATMDCEAREGKPVELLSPVSLGWLVSWRERGYYLAETIEGIKARGIAPMSFTPNPHDPTPRKFVDGWEEAAMRHRILDAWDTDNSTLAKRIQYGISVLATASSDYIAYDWWGHALECVGVVWDETVANNLCWVIRNSHDEDNFIELTGDKAVPDEQYGIVSTLTMA
jgi:hypothetical protein